MYYNLKQPVIIDVYEGEYPVNYPPIYRAIFRASAKFFDGVIREDLKVKDYVSQAKDKNQKYGLYHFMLPNSVNRQLDTFLGVIRKYGLGHMPAILDAECDPAPYGIDREEWAYQIKVFLDGIEKETGYKPVIYTSAYFWTFVAVNGLWNVNDYPLWTAYYPRPVTYVDSVHVPPVLPKGWVKWAMWQWTDRGRTDKFYANDYNIPSEWFKFYLDEKFGKDTPPTQDVRFPYSIRIENKEYKEINSEIT